MAAEAPFPEPSIALKCLLLQCASSEYHRLDILISFFKSHIRSDGCTPKLFVGTLAKCLHDINLLAHVLAPDMNISNAVPGNTA